MSGKSVIALTRLARTGGICMAYGRHFGERAIVNRSLTRSNKLRPVHTGFLNPMTP
jgi:hypothetical protein